MNVVKTYLYLICLISPFFAIHAEFPLEDPCLETCDDGGVETLTASTLQTCIDKCLTLDHCCGNRLNGEDPATAAQMLSCANGCEIAYYRSSVAECKADCQEGNNQAGCEYNHPNILQPFDICQTCACDKWPAEDACSTGCDLAAELPEFYQYEEAPVTSTCEQDDVPRFLFAGQSNMEGWSEQALPGSFRKIVNIIDLGLSKKATKGRLRKLMNKAEAAEPHTSKNEARFIYGIRKLLTKDAMLNDHPSNTCSFTMPGEQHLDCERPLSSTACGGSRSQYGPEFMFGHAFPKRKSPLKKKKISISKVAVGGTQIYENWMKENKDDDQNYWNALVDVIKGGNGSFEGFVWFQGENDAFNDSGRDNYLEYLTEFVADVRQEIFATSNKFSSPEDVPVIIVEVGYWIDGLWDDIGKTIIQAQNDFVANDPNAMIVKSGAGTQKENLSGFYHYDSASILIVGVRIANAMAKLLRMNANRG